MSTRYLLHSMCRIPGARSGLLRALILIPLALLPLGARTVDTTIAGDGGPGPYPLGRLFVNKSSIRAAYADSAGRPVPPFTYVADMNGILFAEPIDSGRMLDISYTTSFYGLPKTYSLYERYAIDTTDSAGAPRVTADGRLARMFADEKLDVSGYKSVGISVGNQGQMNLEQALEVRIFGDIAPETELSANLSDQGTSLEGDTRELGELDMVYIALNNPQYQAIVGDQYVDLPPGGILYERKKIKGMSAGWMPGGFFGKAFGAIAGGKYAVETFRGQQGFQGPYYLSGNGEPDLITPIGGTVRVFVDGDLLAEGDEADYTVDYDLGAIRFTPVFPIRDEHVIKAEYEYKTFDYQRMFFGGDVGYENEDSSIAARGVIWYETDNKNNPIEIDLTDAIRDSMRSAGDDPPPFSTAREVHPNDVASHSEIYPLYRLAYDPALAESVLVYTPYDRANPYDNKGYYYVWFREVGPGAGDYELDTIDYRGARYRFAGQNQGAYTPNAPVPAPQRTVTGEMVTTLSPRPWLSVAADIAGEERDRNLLSDRDDNDNASSAAKTSARVGRMTYDDRCLWTGGNYTFISERFSREVISQYERKVRWGREYDVVSGGEQHAWESFLGSTVFPGATTEFTYGHYLRNDSLLTHRSANESRLALGDRFLLEYDGDFFRHMDSVDMKYLHHDRLDLTLDFERMRYGLLFDDEWKSNGADTVRGRLGGGADFTVKPINLFEEVYYAQHRLGDRWLVTAADTGSYFAWNQKLRHSPLDGWTLSGSSSFQRRVRRDDTVMTTLIAAGNQVVSARAGISTRQHYTVSSERASEFVQLSRYVGEGQGMYSLDTVTNELAPDQFGDYYVYEQEVFDKGSDRRVRKTSLNGDWSFRPPVRAPKGFLADIAWRGTFGLREHIRSEKTLRAGSWLPGYYSLRVGDREKIEHATLFYRQDADWRTRETARQSHIGLHIRPAYKLVRRIEERELVWGFGMDRTWDKWHLGVTGEELAVWRDGVPGAPARKDTLKDQYVEFLERYEMFANVFVFVKEALGRAGKDRTERAWGQYYIGQPGVRFQPRDRGFAEASYTITYVDVDGALDYRMARGYNAGLSHTISIFADIRVGENFSVSGNYRGEYTRRRGESEFDKGLHVVSLEVKAYL
ncbi:MAG: hypothetical protein GF418_11805 [Chitinivibrionales bacterium]|nr:hypothetical protein [Chitinivibrionales bacterium]MBD3396301.1 hypothetical protein [Chitinivibrionales bacterium]